MSRRALRFSFIRSFSETTDQVATRDGPKSLESLMSCNWFGPFSPWRSATGDSPRVSASVALRPGSTSPSPPFVPEVLVLVDSRADYNFIDCDFVIALDR